MSVQNQDNSAPLNSKDDVRVGTVIDTRGADDLSEETATSAETEETIRVGTKIDTRVGVGHGNETISRDALRDAT